MKSLYIAEIGINHHGSLSKAFRMIKLAKDSGAHIAKFQFYDPIRLLGKDYPDLDYIAHCQFKRSDHERLKDYCDNVGLEYLVSVFDVRDILWADSLCKRHKVASRMNRDLEFIALVDRCKKPTIMSIQPELPLRSTYRDRFYFMRCVTKYPATKQEVLLPHFSYKYGLSSHCPDYTASVEAYKRGARIFENHVIENSNEKGCDVSSSITFEDYRKMVTEIENLSKSAERERTPSSSL